MITTKIGSGVGPLLCMLALGESNVLRIYLTRRTLDTIPKLSKTIAEVTTLHYNGPRWSNDGRYLALYTQSGLVFQERDGLTFTSKTVPSNIATSYGGTGISLDGNYVALACQASPFLRIFFNNAGTLASITSLGTAAASGAVAVSYNGTYVAILRNVSPFLQIKKRTGSGALATFSDITIATQPAAGSTTGGSGAVAFSPNATYCLVSYSGGQSIYKLNSTTGLYDISPTLVSGSVTSCNGYGAVFSADENWMALSNASTTQLFELVSGVYIYRVSLSGGYQGSFDFSGNYYLAGSGKLYKKQTAISWQLLHTLATATGAAFAPSTN